MWAVAALTRYFTCEITELAGRDVFVLNINRRL